MNESEYVGYGKWQNGYSRKSPCYKCDKRVSGCHSTCEDYANYKKIRKAEYDYLQKQFASTQSLHKKKKERRKKPCMRRE